MRCRSWLLLGLLAVSGLVQAQSTSRFQTAYYAKAYGQFSATLVDWFVEPYGLPHGTARLVDRNGVVTGLWENAYLGRVLTLDQPRVLDGGTLFDSCHQNVPVRIHQTRFMFKMVTGFERRGTTAVTVDEQGVVSEGCDAGRVLWNFTIFDPVTPQAHLQMKARKGHDDLIAGARLAGLTEAQRIDSASSWQMPDDITRFEAGRSFVRFERTGTRVPYTQSPSGWLVLNFPWGQRAYTRLEVDEWNGEAWLMADLQDGEPKWIEEVLAVKPLRTAGWESVIEAAHIWQSGFTLHNPEAQYLQRLYRDGSGERGPWNSVTGQGSFSPITWRLEGANLVQQIPMSGVGYRLRTWEPLRTVGTMRWVMEEDTVYPTDGAPWNYFPRRVHPQVDQGALDLPVVQRSRAATSAAQRSEATGSGLRQSLAPSLQSRRW